MAVWLSDRSFSKIENLENRANFLILMFHHSRRHIIETYDLVGGTELDIIENYFLKCSYVWILVQKGR